MSQLNSINVALCADKYIQLGLHVTLYSLLQHAETHVEVYLLHKSYTDKELFLIEKTLFPFKAKYTLHPIKFDSEALNHIAGLHGNTFCYSRLFLGNILNVNRVLYLDSDLLITKDLTNLFYTSMEGCVVGVAGVRELRYALDKDMLLAYGHDASSKYFNSGVMLIDLDRWRKQDIFEKCIEFANANPDSLVSHDQTILNYIFYKNDFLELDSNYNIALYPFSKSVIKDCKIEGIFHFVGSPKPWDLFAEFVHGNYPFFREILCKTEFKKYNSLINGWSKYRLKRTILILPSYYRCLKKSSWMNFLARLLRNLLKYIP